MFEHLSISPEQPALVSLPLTRDPSEADIYKSPPSPVGNAQADKGPVSPANQVPMPYRKPLPEIIRATIALYDEMGMPPVIERLPPIEKLILRDRRMHNFSKTSLREFFGARPNPEPTRSEAIVCLPYRILS